VFVKFAIPAEEVDAVKSGDAADVVINHRDETVAATVGHVAPELDGVAQLIIADAELVNPPADLQPGAVGWIIPRASAHRGVSSAPLTSTTTRSTEVLR
jgi:hypothetical protein